MNQSVISDRIYMAVKLMMANTVEVQEHWNKHGHPFFKDLSVIRVGGPRGSGHTTTINRLVEEFGDDEVIVICRNLDMAHDIKAKRVASINSLNRVRGWRASIVLVDTASSFSRHQIDEIIEVCRLTFTSLEHPLYILIG